MNGAWLEAVCKLEQGMVKTINWYLQNQDWLRQVLFLVITGNIMILCILIDDKKSWISYMRRLMLQRLLKSAVPLTEKWLVFVSLPTIEKIILCQTIDSILAMTYEKCSTLIIVDDAQTMAPRYD